MTNSNSREQNILHLLLASLSFIMSLSSEGLRFSSRKCIKESELAMLLLTSLEYVSKLSENICKNLTT